LWASRVCNYLEFEVPWFYSFSQNNTHVRQALVIITLTLFITIRPQVLCICNSNPIEFDFQQFWQISIIKKNLLQIILCQTSIVGTVIEFCHETLKKPCHIHGMQPITKFKVKGIKHINLNLWWHRTMASLVSLHNIVSMGWWKSGSWSMYLGKKLLNLFWH
jgi:hypothetical protein